MQIHRGEEVSEPEAEHSRPEQAAAEVQPHPVELELSIIIPTLNEETEISRLLGELQGQTGLSFECIVVDGGSDDRTIEKAQRAGARCLKAEAGRGRQMNVGAQEAKAPLLLFLHADSSLRDPETLLRAIRFFNKEMQKLRSDSLAGHFSLEFDTGSAEKSRAYRYYEEKTHLNRCNTTNGDQGFLLSKQFFQDVGRFEESLLFLEDQKLAETIRKRGSWVTLPSTLRTSARRFEKEGLARRMILSAIVMGLHESNFHAFFREAPALYRSQRDSQKLQLTPFCRCIHELLRKEGPAVALSRWTAVGRYVRENAWQLAFPVDVFLSSLTNKKMRPLLWAHDALFRPLVTAPYIEGVTAAITGGLTCIWFYLTWGYFAVIEQSSQERTNE